MTTPGNLEQLSSEANWRRQVARRLGGVGLDTTATLGFLYVPTCAGVPTGVPDPISGMAAVVIDETDNRLYFYSSGAWRNAGP